MEWKFWQDFLILMLVQLSTRPPLKWLHDILYVIHYTWYAEVLTSMDQLRTVLNLPISRVCTYSADPLNLVGAEYIIEEKAEGVPLESLWYQWQTESRLNLVTQLLDFETELTSLSFRRHGCIYYKKDLEMKGLPAYDLEAKPLLCGGRANEPDPALLEDFALGPLTEARLWEDDRATMVLDRGPCKLYVTPL